MSHQAPYRFSHSHGGRGVSCSGGVSTASSPARPIDPAVSRSAYGVQWCSRYGNCRRSCGVGPEEALQEAHRYPHCDGQRDRHRSGEGKGGPVLLYAQLPLPGGISLSETVRVAERPERRGVVRLLDPGEAGEGVVHHFPQQHGGQLRAEHKRDVERAAQHGEREERASELHEEAIARQCERGRGLLRSDQQDSADGPGGAAGSAAVPRVPVLRAACSAGSRGVNQCARDGAGAAGAGLRAVAAAHRAELLRGAALLHLEGRAGDPGGEMSRHPEEPARDRAAARGGVRGAGAGHAEEQRARAGGAAETEERHQDHHQAQGAGGAS